jgi:hypothetical protein
LARQDRPLKQGAVQLPLKLAEGPPLAGSHAQVELPFLVPLVPAQDRQVVAPGQFSQQCCEFWLAAVSLEELHHSPGIAGGKAPGVGLPRPYVLGQGLDGPLAPAVSGDLAANVLADVPLQVDQLLIDGGHGGAPGGVGPRSNAGPLFSPAPG